MIKASDKFKLQLRHMKNLDQSGMGSSNQPMQTEQKPQSKTQPLKIPSRTSNYTQSNPLKSNDQSNKHFQLTTSLPPYTVSFTFTGEYFEIKCTSKTKPKKFYAQFSHSSLPKAIQVTYKSLQQFQEEIKYVIEENLKERLRVENDGKFIFCLQTKKKGKIEYLEEVFELQEESEEKIIMRLEEQIQRLKERDIAKSQLIHQLESRLQKVQRLLKIPHQSSQRHSPQRQNSPQKAHSSYNTIQTQPDTQILPQTSTIPQEQSLIKKFKKSKSSQNLATSLPNQQSNTQQNTDQVLRTQINSYDCYVHLESPQLLTIQLLSRLEAKIYRCTVTPETIPKEVYSFVPTPLKLYEELTYIISTNLTKRLDVIDNNFIYRASINAQNKEVLVDGVFETCPMRQDDLQRIEQLIDIRASSVETAVNELKLQMKMLKTSLQCNDLILTVPQNFASSSAIITTTEHFITLNKFFKQKISQLSLLYRASQHNFSISKFHDMCDGIPNTLTIILTQYNKIIGGFTSELWDRNGQGRSSSDYQAHSFIFSVTNRHKFTLQQHQHAIQCSSEDGPRFGNGADLVIKDKANENNNSYANICTSYTHPKYTYKNSDSYKLFSGDDKTNRFKILEWEVFQVFFEE